MPNPSPHFSVFSSDIAIFQYQYQQIPCFHEPKHIPESCNTWGILNTPLHLPLTTVLRLKTSVFLTDLTPSYYLSEQQLYLSICKLVVVCEHFGGPIIEVLKQSHILYPAFAL